jgi:hypothetical protein
MAIRTHKVCPQCKQDLALDCYGKRKSGGPQSYCRECTSAVGRRWAKENSERHYQNGAAWLAANRDRASAYRETQKERRPDAAKISTRKSYQKHSEKRRAERRAYYENNRELEAERFRAWRKSNPEKSAFRTAAYDARARQATPPWVNKAEIEAIYAECRRMNASSEVKYQVDHIHPLCSPVLCGLHVPHNLQIITARENQRKSNSLVALAD